LEYKIKKAFIDCTFVEIIEEVWYQIENCPGLSTLPTSKNKLFQDIKILDYYIWDSFYVNSANKIDTWEPKYPNNVGCFNLCPTPASSLKNLFFATTYTKNSSKIFTMDSAVESGLLASKEILDCDKKQTNLIKITEYSRLLNKYVW
jgi:hypothetical protein